MDENKALNERSLREARARKMDAVGRLAGGIAHDLNNILGAIEGYATLNLRKLAEDDPLRADLGEIRKAVSRGAALTRQLMVFSRKQAIRSAALRPEGLIAAGLKALREGLAENITIETELQAGLPEITGDSAQLGQLLANLLVNARDAMPAGGKLRVSARLEPLPEACAAFPGQAAGLYLRLSVSDTGAGMAPSVAEHLFEPFFTTKEKGRGAGFGLAAAYGIARQHGGWIDVRTAEGKGTEFSVLLPAAAAGAVKI